MSFKGQAAASGRIDSVGNPRPVRVAFPVQVRFEGLNFHVEEFTANLSVGGIFLPPDESIPVRTRGSLTFRLSQWDEPFTVEAEVVWGADEGVGLMFVDLSDDHRRRLERLVGGIRDGSVTEAIRRSLTRPGTSLQSELRRRPTDQKVMFAVAAWNTEIDALIQDGCQAAILRVLANPRLHLRQVHRILKDPRSQATVLLKIFREQRWMRDHRTRMYFCLHPQAPIEKIEGILPRLPLTALRQIAGNQALRQPVADRARQLLKSRSA